MRKIIGIVFLLMAFIASANTKETLPDAKINPGDAKVKVNIIGEIPNDSLSMTIIFFPSLSFVDGYKETVYLDDKRNLSMEIPLLMPTNALIKISSTPNTYVFLSPEEEVELEVKFEEGKGIITDFRGYLSQTQKDYNFLKFSDGDLYGKEFIEKISNSTTPEERLKVLKEEKDKGVDIANSLPVTDAVRAMVRMGIEEEFLYWIKKFGTALVGRQAYLKIKELPDADNYGRILAETDSLLYPLNEKQYGTDEYIEVLGAPYAPVFSGFWDSAVPLITYLGADGSPNDYNRSLINAYTLLSGDRHFDSNELMNDIEFEDCLDIVNRSLLEHKLHAIELSKNPSVYCGIYDDVLPENILQTILDKYKGKTVFIDIWATWCQPCIKSHKELELLKGEEDFNDVVWVYVTGPDSPLSDWETMITKVSGEQYYLTQQQLSRILKDYDSTGFPTYSIYDKKGHHIYQHIGYPGIDILKNKLIEAVHE